MCITVSNEPKYCAYLCVNNVLYVYNCIHEKAVKPSCILYLRGLRRTCMGSQAKALGIDFRERGSSMN